MVAEKSIDKSEDLGSHSVRTKNGPRSSSSVSGGMDTIELLSPRDENVVIASALVVFLDLLFEAFAEMSSSWTKKRMITQYDLSVEVDKRASIIDAFSKPTDMPKKAELREALRMTDNEEKGSQLLLDMEKADGPRILLLDAKMGSVNLNLTGASIIIFRHYFGAPDIAPFGIEHAH
ncbi:hypothetical protein CDV31_007930 [Fusarium ambrosium]|uniref:Uncharacterized protein n=1 Tax=Fusarium ambrosium TaxID=131363 RepID=A0A428U3H7_9HYPO|nr:hypothetical protein CDV31_007930 [Fusarium ambrosium]